DDPAAGGVGDQLHGLWAGLAQDRAGLVAALGPHDDVVATGVGAALGVELAEETHRPVPDDPGFRHQPPPRTHYRPHRPRARILKAPRRNGRAISSHAARAAARLFMCARYSSMVWAAGPIRMMVPCSSHNTRSHMLESVGRSWL